MIYIKHQSHETKMQMYNVKTSTMIENCLNDLL